MGDMGWYIENIKEGTMKLVARKRVRCVIEGKVIENARLQYENGKWYLCQDEKAGSNCKDKLGYEFSWVFGVNGSGEYSDRVNWIKPFTSTDIEDVCAGSLVRSGVYTYKILGICGEIAFLSSSTNSTVYGSTLTIDQMKKRGWTLVPEEEPEEEKMIEIDGKKWSEGTIKEALKKHAK